MINNRKFLVLAIGILAATPFLTKTMQPPFAKVLGEGPLKTFSFENKEGSLPNKGNWTFYGWMNVPEFSDRVFIEVTGSDDQGGWYTVKYVDPRVKAKGKIIYRMLPKGLFYWESIDKIKHQPKGREYSLQRDGTYSNSQNGEWDPTGQFIHPSKQTAQAFDNGTNTWRRKKR
jgi:hypothetical protein